MDLTIINQGTDERGFEWQTAKHGDFVIERLRSPRAAPDAEFLPSRVYFIDKLVWSFAEERRAEKFVGSAFLREVDDELVIMICSRHKLYSVVPIRDLSSKYHLVEMKEALAVSEDLQPVWSEQEVALRDADITAVTKESPPATATDLSIPPVVEITVKGEEKKVFQLANIDEIRGLRNQGVNDGALAMCPKAGSDERHTVFSITNGKIKPVTEVLYKK